MRRTKMVVVDVYQLPKMGGSFTKTGKVLKRSSIAMERDWVDRKNNNWQNAGMWHEIDEEATDDFYELQKQRREDKKKAKATTKRFNEALSGVLETSKTITPIEVEAEQSTEDADELAELRAEYKEKFNKRAFHGWGIDKLKEKMA